METTSIHQKDITEFASFEDKHRKITDKDIAELNSVDLFGEWTKDGESLKSKFQNAKPFGHIVIDNFLRSDVAEKAYKHFPTNYDDWHKYENPLEVKYAFDDINKMESSIRDIFLALSSEKLIKAFSQISGIENLEYDPCLHGAGLHSHPRNGRLNIHLDYEKHPLLNNKERRLNIILYLTKGWKSEWNGDNQLWDKKLTQPIVKTEVKFNRAIIFQTNNISWHGLPEKILCPPGKYRKSLAYYYISDLVTKPNKNKVGNDGSGHRLKATYVQHPHYPKNDKFQEFINIRPKRRIEKEDILRIMPEWNAEDF